jgi:hypothetical protein
MSFSRIHYLFFADLPETMAEGFTVVITFITTLHHVKR